MEIPDLERNWKSHPEIAPNCPRCSSANTKFCYYNNYSLSQPRYFCKGCRRYWTKGGSLRNVPVGGGCRKNRRAKSARVYGRGTDNNLSSFNRNPDDEKSCSSSDQDCVVQEIGTNGSDIDLAVVFAKFLNQDSSSEENGLNPDGRQTDGMIECQKPADLINIESNLVEEIPQGIVGEKKQEGEERIQEFMGINSEMNAYGLRSLMSEEMLEQDVLWSDIAASNLPNFTWQPMVQLQEFDSFSASTNPITDPWSSFDLWESEGFSRP